MKRLLTVGVFVLQGLGLAFAAAAVDGTDISGTVREVASGTATSVFENFTAASGDATIRLVPPLYGERFIGNFRLYVTDVTVTIDATEVTSASLIRLSGDIVTYGTGKVIVKGVTTVAFGNASSPVYSSTSMPVLDADFTFEDASGDGLVLMNGVTLLRRPTCAFSIADGAGIGVRGDSILGDATDGLAVDHFNLLVADEPGSGRSVSGPITVSDGHWLVYKPCSVNYNPAGSSYAWAGGDGTLSNDVCLAAGATLYVPSKNANVALIGAISGEGTIDLKNDNYNAQVEFSGDCSAFSGTFNMAHPTRKVIVKGNFACGQMNWSSTDGTLTVASGALASFGTFSGVLAPTGAGEVRITAFAENAVVHDLASGTLVVVDSDADLVTSAIDRLYVKPPVSDGAFDYVFVADKLKEGVAYSMSARDGAKYFRIPESVRLTVADNVSAHLYLTGPTNAVSLAPHGSLSTSDGKDLIWRGHVMKWIDPSVADSWVEVSGGAQQEDAKTSLPWYVKNRTFPQVRAITDCRSGAEYRGSSFASDKANANKTSGISPLAITNGLNGLTVLSFGCGSNRRAFNYALTLKEIEDLGLSDAGKGTGDTSSFYPKFAVLVYGSQGGGGSGMFSSNMTDEYFKRTNNGTVDRFNKNLPIFDNDIPTWRDGVRLAHANETPHTGEWNIFSVDCSGATKGINGLGTKSISSLTATSGGQAYGEIIFFDKVLDDDDRVAVERYLANKWGLKEQYRGDARSPVSARLEGSGFLALEDDLVLEGGFAGTVAANGHTLSVSEQSLPPGEEVVIAANPTRWFDPECKGAVELRYATSIEVENMYDRLLPMPLADMETDQVYLSACGRWGKLDVGSRGGSAVNWISYIATTGNLRFRRKGEATGQTSIYNPMDVKTVFLVQDSTYGGGTPFQLNKDSAHRIISRKNMPGTYGRELTLEEELRMPIWNADAYKALRDPATATTYLDGHPVDGATVGFGGKPEVFSVLSSQSFKIGTFADLYYNNDGSTPYPTDRGVVQSEIILFADKIGEADRAKIEAYLAWKWLGEVRTGYTSLHAATLTGAGEVTIPAGAAVPQFGADFSGTASFASDALAFTVTTADPATPVDGLIDVGGGTFAPQSPCTLTVTVADGVNLRSGAFYPLVMGAWADGVDVSLSIAADAKGRELTLESRDGVLGLAVGKPGLMLLVK